MTDTAVKPTEGKKPKATCRCCKRPPLARGLCASHYRAWRTGRLTVAGLPRRARAKVAAQRAAPGARARRRPTTNGVPVLTLELATLSRGALTALLYAAALGRPFREVVSEAVESWATARSQGEALPEKALLPSCYRSANPAE
jgi:hypothetical protein